MILVTGATGLVGAHLLNLLSKKEDKIRAIYRSEKKMDIVKNVFTYDDNLNNFSKIEWYKADITDVPVLESVFTGITKVYHVAAKVSFSKSQYNSLLKTNVEGTANIVNLCIAYGISKLCYVSSIATLSNKVGQEYIDETCEWNPEEFHTDYGISKYGGEQEVWRGSQEGLDVVIVNPGVIFGSGYWTENTGKIVDKVYKGLPVYTSGTIGVVWVKDVVKVMHQLMESNIKNKRYVLVSDNLKFKDVFTKIANTFSVKAPSILVSDAVLKLLYIISSVISILSFGLIKGLSKSTLKVMKTKTVYDGVLITKDIPFNYTPFDKVCKTVANNYLS